MRNISPIPVLALAVLFILPAITAASGSCGKTLLLGAEKMDEITALLQGKRTGLLVNHTSVLPQAQVHLLDTLLAAGVDVRQIFAPEHGFRGTAEAGETIRDGKDTKTGLPILSLYGKNRKPTPRQMEGIDAVVFDIQDVGARFYTYISTLHYMMEACAENNVEMIVLDRPNPCDFVDGPVRGKRYESFVGMHPIPVLHGLTVGELALMINAEGWLKSNPGACRLSVVRMEDWRHGQPYDLPVAPSPNLPNAQSIRLYASLCFFEATNFSIGRGTPYPFQVIGYPDANFGRFTFTPVSLKGFDMNPVQKDKKCYGVDLRQDSFDKGLTLRFILDFYNLSGKDPSFFFARPEWFDLLAGTSVLRRQISDGMSEDEIRASWQADLERYRQIRKKYLLYPDAD